MPDEKNLRVRPHAIGRPKSPRELIPLGLGRPGAVIVLLAVPPPPARTGGVC